MANWKASSKLVFPALFVADKHSQIIQFDLDVRQGTKISDADRDYFDSLDLGVVSVGFGALAGSEIVSVFLAGVDFEGGNGVP